MLKARIRSIKRESTQYESAILSTLSAFFDAHQFIHKHNFRKYLLVSGFGFLLLFSVTIKLLLVGVDSIEHSFSGKLVQYLQYLIRLSADEIQKGITALFWLLKIAIETNKDSIFSGIFLVIGTPFFSFISSKTEEAATGKSYVFRWTVFLKEIARGISLSFRNALKQLLLILLITLLGQVPLIGIIAPLLTFIVQAYYNGILMTDYTLERQGYTVRESVALYKIHKPEMFAIGLGFMFLLLIPVVGWFIAPIYGLVAAYIQFSKLSSKSI